MGAAGPGRAAIILAIKFVMNSHNNNRSSNLPPPVTEP